MQIKGVNTGDYPGTQNVRTKKQKKEDGVFRENLFQNPGTDQEDKTEPARTKKMAEVANGILPDYRLPRYHEITGMFVSRIPETWQSRKVPPEGLSYKQADKIKLDILEGYVLKARKKEASEGSPASVYLEIKWDDGRTEGYILQKDDVDHDNRSEAEQFVYEMFT